MLEIRISKKGWGREGGEGREEGEGEERRGRERGITKPTIDNTAPERKQVGIETHRVTWYPTLASALNNPAPIVL